MVTISSEVKNREKAIRPFIEKYAELFELDPNLVRALITQESRFIATATSPTGAYGLGQFTNIGAKQVQNIAAMTPKAVDLKNFTKPQADNPDVGVKAICATLWWLYYRKYASVDDKKIRLEACLTFYNAGGKAGGLVVQHGGHSQAVPFIKQLPAAYRSQADKYAAEVSLWFIAWHEVIQKEKAEAATLPTNTEVFVGSNPFDSKIKKMSPSYAALVSSLKTLADIDPSVDIILNSREGFTEVTLIFVGEY